MNWSKRKCRKIAVIISFFYVLLGFIVMMNLGEISKTEYLQSFLELLIAPLFIPIFYAVFNGSIWVILSVFILLWIVVWLFFDVVLWLIKGDKNVN